MALICIVLIDSPQGPQLRVDAEPAMPANALQGPPTPAQSAAALMLNALTDGAKTTAESAPRIWTPHN